MYAVITPLMLLICFVQSPGKQPAGKTFQELPEVVPIADTVPVVTETKSSLSESILKGDKPKWIWGSDFEKSYRLKKSFKISDVANVKDALIRASSDNEVSLSINGTNIGSSTEWQAPLEKSLKPLLKQGENTIEATVSNQGGIAGFVCKLVVQSNDGSIQSILSDASWQAIKGNDTSEVKVVATYGDGPWGDVLANPASGPNDRDRFHVPAGFQVERLYQVPRDELGSWVCLTVDPKGRLIASDQGNLGLVRITPSPIGSKEPTKVEKLNVDISSAQGLLFAFNSLYVCVNGDHGALCRLRDTDGDDQFDEKTKLFDFRGAGEHGPHALRLSPDGKSIVIAAGNHTLPPVDRTLKESKQLMGNAREGQLHASLPENFTSRIAPNWDEDVLPTRLWDANGHATGIYAPGGWMAQTDPDGKSWEMLSVGYRNQYDFDFNADGEMFVYDSDMEWDMGTSWYRPTRVVHASSGSEFGWRSGTACWPTYFADSLPSLVDIGPGSPVGVSFGYNAKFPAKYQKALFICDWTFGTMYAIHLQPNGSTYQATKEEFVSRTPLPLTDVVIGTDGAMYFTVGGRGTQSELYRVTYVGNESTARVDYHDAKGDSLRKLRHEIEKSHASDRPALQWIKELGNEDSYVRYAARVALERHPVKEWASDALKATSVDGLIQAAMGIARAGEHDDQESVFEALDRLAWKKLDDTQKLATLRAYELGLIRLGKPTEARQAKLITRLEEMVPDKSDFVNRELAVLLVHLNAPSAPNLFVPMLNQSSQVDPLSSDALLARNRGYGSSIAAMMANQPDLQQVHLAFVLREQKAGWTVDLRKQYFAWFLKAQKWNGGNSYQKFLINISNDAFANASDSERLTLEALGLRTPLPVPKELPKAQGPGKDYALDEITKLAGATLKGRNFDNGRKMYAAARCVVCHRFAGEGGATGPDLTQAAGRFSLKDLAEAIVDPSKVISDQYKTVIVSTEAGDVHSGRIVVDSPDSLVLSTDPEDSTKVVTIQKSDIAGSKTSTESVMPRELLKSLNEQEVLDLLAYLLARGNANDAVFKK